MREEMTRFRKDDSQVSERRHELYGSRADAMTSTEIRSELGRIQNAFDWCLTRGCIRGQLKNDRLKRVFDPITAVVFSRTGKFVQEGCWSEAADLIGLQAADCADIIAASNYTWDPGCRQGQLRQDLLDVVMPELRQPGTRRGDSSWADLTRDSAKKVAAPAD